MNQGCVWENSLYEKIVRHPWKEGEIRLGLDKANSNTWKIITGTILSIGCKKIKIKIPQLFVVFQMFNSVSQHEHPTLLSIADRRIRIFGLRRVAGFSRKNVSGFRFRNGHETVNHQHTPSGNTESVTRCFTTLTNRNYQVYFHNNRWDLNTWIPGTQLLNSSNYIVDLNTEHSKKFMLALESWCLSVV